MKLELYYAPQTCALVPYVTLTEAGADFEVRPINTRAGDNRKPEFLTINPKHKVPVLIIDGEPLTENIAIQIWIDRQFPAAKLLPKDPGEEIKAISLIVVNRCLDVSPGLALRLGGLEVVEPAVDLGLPRGLYIWIGRRMKTE